MSQANIPVFPKQDNNPVPDLDAEDVALLTLVSIALEEMGLAHIINAEGEKIQWALGTLGDGKGPAYPPTVAEILDINQSVRDTLEVVITKEAFLNMKFEKVLRVLEYAQETSGYPAAPAQPVQP